MFMILINLLFLIILFVLVKIRTSKNLDNRLLANDYEFYSSLPSDKKEVYWNHATKTMIIYFISIIAIVNGVTLVSRYFTSLQIIGLFLLILVIVTIIYSKCEINYRRKVSGKKKVHFFNG